MNRRYGMVHSGRSEPRKDGFSTQLTELGELALRSGICVRLFAGILNLHGVSQLGTEIYSPRFRDEGRSFMPRPSRGLSLEKEPWGYYSSSSPDHTTASSRMLLPPRRQTTR
jgi:hypothetical protein